MNAEVCIITVESGQPTGIEALECPMNDDNGILASIPGQYVAAATSQLTEAALSTEKTAETALDVPGFGRVRFSARRMMSKKGRATIYWWSVTRAVRVD